MKSQKTYNFSGITTITRWFLYFQIAHLLLGFLMMLEPPLIIPIIEDIYSLYNNSLFLWFVSGIFILIWIYEASSNAHNFGSSEMRFSSGWSVGWFFIPIFQLFYPYQAMKEIWLVSFGETDSHKGVVGTWWFLWIIVVLPGVIAFAVSRNTYPSLDAESSEVLFGMAGLIQYTLELALAFATLSLVNKLSKRQIENWDVDKEK